MGAKDDAPGTKENALGLKVGAATERPDTYSSRKKRGRREHCW